MNRGEYLAAALFHGGDVLFRGEPSVHGVVLRCVAVTCHDVVMQRSHLSPIAARVRHIHAHNHAGAAVSAELHVVRRTIAAIGHLHLSRLGICRAASRLCARASLLFLLVLLQLRQFFQRLLHAFLAILSRTQSSGIAAFVARIVLSFIVTFITQTLHLLACLLVTFL